MKYLRNITSDLVLRSDNVGLRMPANPALASADGRIEIMRTLRSFLSRVVGFDQQGLSIVVNENEPDGIAGGTVRSIRRRRVMNSLLLIGTATSAAMTFHPSFAATAVTPDADFSARCSAPGVIYCNGFDATADFKRSSGGSTGTVAADSDGGRVLFAQDTSTKSSGTSSLRVDIPTSYTGGDPGGFWVFFTPQPAGSTFYVQFQYRMTPGIQTESVYGSGSSGVKIFDIFAGTLTCQSGEITTEMPVAGHGDFYNYYACGAGLHTNLADTSYTTSSPPYLRQQNNESRGWNCSYGNEHNVAYPSSNANFGANDGTSAGTGCLALPTNTWFTLYYKIHIGNSGTATSTVEAWYAANGLNYAKFTYIPNLNMSPQGQFDGMYFKPYMSERGGGAASTNNSVWYDEIIISTQPIPAPTTASTSQLAPPTNVHVVTVAP